jgi:hypothetical protein
MQYGGFATRPGQFSIPSLGLMLLAGSTFVAALPAQQQQPQDTTRHGWGIVYSSPKSRASSGTNGSASASPASAASSGTPLQTTPTTTPTPSFSQPASAPTAPSQAPPTVLPTIRGSRYSGDPASNSAPAPAAPAPPPNGIYAGDRPAYGPPAAATATVAAPGTYDTIPPSQPGSGGVHLDELMSLHEYTATGLTSLQPQQVQVLEQWLAGYRAALIDSATRTAQRTVSSQQSFAAPAAPAAAVTPMANTRALPPVNSHQVTGIRSGSRFVQIDDGSVWDIYPADQSETANWQVGDNVTVREAQQAYGDFDHELVNAQRTGPVRAKFMGYARQ